MTPAAIMNLVLHGIGGEKLLLTVGDSLASDPGERFEMVLTNPPFGKKSSTTILGPDDLRTNLHFTLKTSPLKHSDLDEFVALYIPANRHERTATWSEESPAGRWRSYDYVDLLARDKASLDIFWLRDESLENSDNLPEPGIIARDMIFDLETALEQLRLIAEDVGENLRLNNVH